MNNNDIKISYYKDKNLEPISLYIEEEKNEVSPNDNIIQLQHIPSYSSGMIITDGKNVYSKVEEITSPYQYSIVNEAYGILKFHSSQSAKKTYTSYNAIGKIMYSSDVIFTNVSSEGEILETLGDIMSDYNRIMKEVGTVGDAKIVIEKTQANIDLLKDVDLTAQIREARAERVEIEDAIDDSVIAKNNIMEANGIAVETSKKLKEDIAEAKKSSFAEEIRNARGGKVDLATRLNESDSVIANVKKQVDTNITNINTNSTAIVNNTTSLNFINKKIEKNLADFPKLNGEIDDSERFQRCIDSFEGNYGGTIIIPNKIFISKTIKIYKTGIILRGYGSGISIINCNVEGMAIDVKPLLNGNPYTNLGWCKFSIDNVKLEGVGKSTNDNSIGLSLQWVYASGFYSLYTSGFKRHVVLRGSHLNTFYSWYGGGEDPSAVETFNKAIGICALDCIGEYQGETTSNNNSFIGGTLHNCTFDFSKMNETIMNALDVEPAGFTCNLGDGNTISNCRLERFDVYDVEKKSNYGKFPWIIVGNDNTIENTSFHQSGVHTNKENPILKINGRFNKINIKGNISMHCLVEINPVTGGNNNITLDLPMEYHLTPVWKSVDLGGLYSGYNDVITFRETNRTVSTRENHMISTLANESTFPLKFLKDCFTTRSCTLTQAIKPDYLNSSDCINISISATDGGIVANTHLYTCLKGTGNYSMNVLIKVDSGVVNVAVGSGVTPTKLSKTAEYKMVVIPFYGENGNDITPNFTGNTGTIFSIAHISFAKEYGIPYGKAIFPSQNITNVEALDSGLEIIPKFSHYDLYVYSKADPTICINLTGTRDTTIPLVIVGYAKGLTFGATNVDGTIAINGASDLKYMLKHTDTR